MSHLLEQLDAEVSAVAGAVRRSLVQITNGRHGAGAGTIWHSEGLILTNAHVVRRPSLQVTLSGGRSLPAQLLAHSKALDLAALSIDARDLPVLRLGRC